MRLEVASIPKLVCTNYLSCNINMVDVLKSKKLWLLVKGEHMKPPYDKDLVIWEDWCDQANNSFVKLF